MMTKKYNTHPHTILGEEGNTSVGALLNEGKRWCVVSCFPGLHESLQPCSRAARKWRENEEMKRKWRENEEMRRKWRENEEMERD